MHKKRATRCSVIFEKWTWTISVLPLRACEEALAPTFLWSCASWQPCTLSPVCRAVGNSPGGGCLSVRYRIYLMKPCAESLSSRRSLACTSPVITLSFSIRGGRVRKVPTDSPAGPSGKSLSFVAIHKVQGFEGCQGCQGCHGLQGFHRFQRFQRFHRFQRWTWCTGCRVCQGLQRIQRFQKSFNCFEGTQGMKSGHKNC